MCITVVSMFPLANSAAAPPAKPGCQHAATAIAAVLCHVLLVLPHTQHLCSATCSLSLAAHRFSSIACNCPAAEMPPHLTSSATAVSLSGLAMQVPAHMHTTAPGQQESQYSLTQLQLL
jgi:hypothetical protein